MVNSQITSKSVSNLHYQKFRITFAIIFLFLLTGCNNADLNPIGGSDPSETAVEMASFDLINQDRKKQGLPELILDLQVASVARAHSADMRSRDFYSHINPDGKNFGDRLRAAGVSFRIAGENLAMMSNIGDPATFANSEFLNHDSHRANILNRRFARAGVGVARSGNKYWITQNFIGL